MTKKQCLKDYSYLTNEERKEICPLCTEPSCERRMAKPVMKELSKRNARFYKLMGEE